MLKVPTLAFESKRTIEAPLWPSSMKTSARGLSGALAPPQLPLYQSPIPPVQTIFTASAGLATNVLAIAKDIALERAPKVRLVLACLLIQLLSTNATEVTSYINQSRVLLFQRQGI
jgi:hypothetical protein